jgi:hypothetical protein
MSLFGGWILNQSPWIDPKNIGLINVNSPEPPPAIECLLSLGNGNLLNLGNNTFLKVTCVTNNNNLFSVGDNELLSVGTEEYLTV